MVIMKLGKYIFDDDVQKNVEDNHHFAVDLDTALYAHMIGAWNENAAKHFAEAKNNERVTATFPTICGDIIIDTLADRTQTIITMA